MSGSGPPAALQPAIQVWHEKQMLSGASIAKLSKEHSIKPGVLYRWRNEAARELGPAMAKLEVAKRENQKLQREMRHLQEQQEVFKIASDWYDQQDSTN